MAIGDLKNLSVDELSKLYQDKKHDMHTLRINAAMGEVKDTSQFRKARHEIARILTVLRQRELAAEAAQKDK
jgi:large subunit ribosomal protein L29